MFSPVTHQDTQNIGITTSNPTENSSPSDLLLMLKAEMAIFEEMPVSGEYRNWCASQISTATQVLSKMNQVLHCKRPFAAHELQDPLAAQRAEEAVKRRRIMAESEGEKEIEPCPTPRLQPAQLRLRDTFANLGGQIHKIVAGKEGTWFAILQKGRSKLVAKITKEGMLTELPSEKKVKDIWAHGSDLFVIYEQHDLVRWYSQDDLQSRGEMNKEHNQDFMDGLAKLSGWDGQLLIGGNKGRIHYLYDFENKTFKVENSQHNQQITAVAMNKDFIVSGSSDRHFVVIAKEAFGSSTHKSKEFMQSTVTALAIDEAFVYAGSKNGLLKALCLTTGQPYSANLGCSIQEIIADGQGYYVATEKQILYYFKPSSEMPDPILVFDVQRDLQCEEPILSMSKCDDQIVFGLKSGAMPYLS